MLLIDNNIGQIIFLLIFSVFGLHSALLQVLVGAGHLEVEILPELLLLLGGAVDRLVGPS